MLWDHSIIHFICFPLPGFVRKSGMMKIVHEKYKSTRKYVDPVISEFQASFESAIDYNKELDNLLNKAQVGSNVSFCHCAHQYIIIIIIIISIYHHHHHFHHHDFYCHTSTMYQALSSSWPSLAIINNCQYSPLISTVIIISQYHGCCRHYIAITLINMNSPPLSSTTNFGIIIIIIFIIVIIIIVTIIIISSSSNTNIPSLYCCPFLHTIIKTKHL